MKAIVLLFRKPAGTCSATTCTICALIMNHQEKTRSITRLTGFSGSYVKNSPAVNKVFKFDYVPLPKASQVMKLDCGVLLPGIYKK